MEKLNKYLKNNFYCFLYMGAFKRAGSQTYRGMKKAVKRRYGLNKKSRMPNYARMVGDVARVVAAVNAEKKFINQRYPAAGAPSYFVGQVNGNNTAAFCQDITPLMGQGTDVNTRTGNSIKLHSSYVQMQFTQQAAAQQAIKVIIEIWHNPAQTLSQTSLLTNMYDPSIFSTVIDSTSARNQDRFSDYRLIRRKYLVVRQDQFSTDSQTKTLSFGVKYNKVGKTVKGHHVRYSGANSTNYLTDIQQGQMFCIVRADVGNISAVTASTLQVPVTAVQTGLSMAWAVKHYYYDN